MVVGANFYDQEIDLDPSERDLRSETANSCALVPERCICFFLERFVGIGGYALYLRRLGRESLDSN